MMMSCKKIQPLLSEFVDNKLSARSTWEVDLHLAECHECTRLLNEMRRTVDLLADSPQFEVSADFMQRLQDRIGESEPAAPRFAWLESVRAAFRPRLLPAWGAGLATCALAALLLIPRGMGVISGTPAPMGQEVRQATRASVALSATDPFADLGVVNLAAQTADRQAE
jgi:anti-sigma factor RsiW